MNAHHLARFAELRSALHQPPSPKAWAQVVHHLNGLSGDPEAITQATVYAEGLLARWPDALRTLPREWHRRMLRGTIVSQASLARTWPVPLRTRRPGRDASQIVHALSAQPGLAHAREITLSHGMLPQPDAIQAFGEAAPRVEALNLVQCMLESHMVEALAALPTPTLRMRQTMCTPFGWQYRPVYRDRSLPAILSALAGGTFDTLELHDEPHTRYLLDTPDVLCKGRLLVRNTDWYTHGSTLHQAESERWAETLARFAAHEALANLVALELSTCGVDDTTLYTLAARDDLRLEALCLGELDALHPRDAPGALASAALVGAPWFGGLHTFETRLSPARGPMLEAMAANPAHLRHLRLTPDSFRGTPHEAVNGLLSLLYSPAAASLVTLELGGSAVDADVIEALRSSDTLRGLEELRLRAPAVSDREIARLSRPGLSVQLLSGAPE